MSSVRAHLYLSLIGIGAWTTGFASAHDNRWHWIVLVLIGIGCCQIGYAKTGRLVGYGLAIQMLWEEHRREVTDQEATR